MERNKIEKKLNFDLSVDEKRLEDEIENEEWNPIDDKEARRLRSEFINAAKNQIKDARVNLRLNPED